MRRNIWRDCQFLVAGPPNFVFLFPRLLCLLLSTTAIIHTNQHLADEIRHGKVGRKAELCAEHADDGTVDALSKRCSRQPQRMQQVASYGTKGSSTMWEVYDHHTKKGILCSTRNRSIRAERNDSGPGRASSTTESADSGRDFARAANSSGTTTITIYLGAALPTQSRD